MNTKKCIAMILAGGRGERLGSLTQYYSKPAVYFGGNYRIIDFTLNNCQNSGIDTVGILCQHFSTDLHAYIDAIQDLGKKRGGIYTLLPQSAETPYVGTADAVYKNTEFISGFNPECVLVLAGDHIYQMDYKKMIDFHMETGADVTVASTPVPIHEASRFGILNADRESGLVRGFEEKPPRPKSDLASMGIYVFKCKVLEKYLQSDNKDERSKHYFGRNILPKMLSGGESIYTYRFDGYWRDVGTVDSLWEANMDQLTDPLYLQLEDGMRGAPEFVSSGTLVNKSIVSGKCSILGTVDHSVLSDSVTVRPGAEVVNSVLMPGVYIGDNVKVYNAVIGTKAVITDNSVIGADDGSEFFVDPKICSRGISLISPWLYISKGLKVQKNSQIYKKRLDEYRIYADTSYIVEPWKDVTGPINLTPTDNFRQLHYM